MVAAASSVGRFPFFCLESFVSATSSVDLSVIAGRIIEVRAA
jgi:hypothetical protein